MNRVRSMYDDGRVIRGLTKNTWEGVIKSDLQILGLDRGC